MIKQHIRNVFFFTALSIALCICCAACNNLNTGSQTVSENGTQAVRMYTYKVVNVFPHDPQAYTQGLEYDNGVLYESTGRFGSSSLRKVELETGRVLQIYRLPDTYFGEGLTIYKDTIVQLTWRNNTGFIYDVNTFAVLREFGYASEGWGITHDGKRLIMSDGTSALYFLDPVNLNATGSLKVQGENGPVGRLNELEYIKGELYANIWGTDQIAIINPESGRVAGWIDLTGLLEEKYRTNPVEVLNGIAYDPGKDGLFVTGKLWPVLFEIKIVPRDK